MGHCRYFLANAFLGGRCSEEGGRHRQVDVQRLAPTTKEGSPPGLTPTQPRHMIQNAGGRVGYTKSAQAEFELCIRYIKGIIVPNPPESPTGTNPTQTKIKNEH